MNILNRAPVQNGCKRVILCLIVAVMLWIPLNGFTATAAVRTFQADFSDLLGYIDVESYDKHGFFTSDNPNAVVNVWMDQKFEMYYSRECHTFQKRNTLGESIGTGCGDSLWNIDFFRGALRATDVAGGEYIRSCESLTVKYNGEQAVLENFEATVEYTYTNEKRGGVYITYHEKHPGKFGWGANPLDKKDHSFIEQDAVMVVTPENGTLSKAGFSGLLVKKYDESFKVLLGTVKGVPQYEGHLVELFTKGMNTKDTYRLYVKVVNGTVTTKLTNTASGVVLVDTRYANAATGAAGTLSVGVANNCALSAIEIKELDKNGDQVPFGTKTASIYPSVLTATTLYLPTTTKYIPSRGVRATTVFTTAATQKTTAKGAVVIGGSTAVTEKSGATATNGSETTATVNGVVTTAKTSSMQDGMKTNATLIQTETIVETDNPSQADGQHDTSPWIVPICIVIAVCIVGIAVAAIAILRSDKRA